MKGKVGFVLIVLMSAIGFFGCKKATEQTSITIQLNWLHDPTFAGEYFLSKASGGKVTLKEGGPNIFPVAEVSGGRATVAVVGSDIFLQALEKDIKGKKEGNLICFFVDFQRNPVGWILHPDAAMRAGLPEGVKGDQKKLNSWLFNKFADGTLKPGDKRGTETTSIWVQWRKVHKLRDTVSVLPVGFDTGIVLAAPMLAYPVYLNEEPFKLSEKIGRPVIVFDPAADGIELYGNVLITTKNYADTNSKVIRFLQASMRESWQKAKDNQLSAVDEVASVYKGVSSNVVRMQIEKTLEFVFYANQLPGTIDIRPTGRWAQTLAALQEGGMVGQDLTFDKVKKYLLPPE